MTWFRWFRREDDEGQLRREFEAHLAERVDDLRETGLADADARRQARREFGNVVLHLEDSREVWHWRWLDDARRDAQYAVRSLGRSPGFTAVALFTLAVGLGANTAIFSVINAVLLRPLPYAGSDRLVLIENPSLAGIPATATSEWRARSRTLEDFAGFQHPAAATLEVGGEPVQVEVAQANWNFFQFLGVSPAVGKVFTEADAASSAEVAVLTHSFWLRQFGGESRAVETTVTLTDMAGRTHVTIVGVLPPGFPFPSPDGIESMPLFATPQPDIIRLATGKSWLKILGRLSPSSTPEAATVELGGIFEQVMRGEFSASFFEKAKVTATLLEDRLVGDARHRLLVVMGAAGCVLLVVCANLANLLLARVSNRRTEFAIRAALGARTSRLARLLLTETLLLAMLGSGGALLLAYGTGGLARSMLAHRVSHVETVPIGGLVLAFNILLAATVGVISSLASMTGARSARLVAAFTQGGGGRSVTSRSGLRHALLAAEIACAFVLVVSAALLCRTLWNLYHSDRGYDGDRVVTAAVMPNMRGTIPELQGLTSTFFDDLTQRIRALPGLETASAATNVPFSGGGMGMSGVSLVGTTPGEAANGGESVSITAVTPGYFATIGARLTAGRDFGGADAAGRERVAIVNETLRSRIAAGQPLVGARIQFGRHQLTVVGVADDLPDTSLRQPARAFVYVPLSQVLGTNFAFARLTILARARGTDPVSLLPTLRQAIWAHGHDIVIDEVATMDERLAASVRKERDSALLFGALAAIALIVAVAGVYGVVAYSVARRTREIGIRIALGANRHRVVGDIVRESARPVVAGIAIGLAGALVTTRALQSLLFETEPHDPATLTLTAVVLAGTAFAAAWLPARRATRVDPVTALRAE
jgi:predicted permease